MAWSGSAIFQQWLKNPMLQAIQGSSNAALPTSMSTTGGILTDTINVALFLTGAAPDKTAAVGSTGYNTGTWSTTNEAPGTGGYTQSGTALGTKSITLDSGSSSVCFTAANASWTSATISSVFGDFVYDNTITTGELIGGDLDIANADETARY